MMDDSDGHTRQPGGQDNTKGDRVWQLMNAAGFDPTRLCESALARLTGVDGLGLSTQAPWPDSRVRYASDRVSMQIENLQDTLAEGPCRAAMITGQPVLVPDVSATDPTRWPAFIPAALEVGVRALFAMPMHAGALRPGTINFYRSTPGPLTRDDRAEAMTLTAAATELLAPERLGLDLTDTADPDPGDAVTGPADRPRPILVRRLSGNTLIPLRSEVHAIGTRHGLAGISAYKFVLAVYEAISNVIRHSGGDGILLLWRRANALWCEVSDHGPGLPPTYRNPSRPTHADGHGYGLWLIRQTTASLDITTDRTGSRVLFSYPLDPSEGA